jgi:hypothetical protein
LRVWFADRAVSDIEMAQLHDGKSLNQALVEPNAHKKQLEGYYSSAMDPTAALIKDSKKMGMPEDRLTIWGGEFGWTSYSQSLSDIPV